MHTGMWERQASPYVRSPQEPGIVVGLRPLCLPWLASASPIDAEPPK